MAWDDGVLQRLAAELTVRRGQVAAELAAIDEVLGGLARLVPGSGLAAEENSKCRVRGAALTDGAAPAYGRNGKGRTGPADAEGLIQEARGREAVRPGVE